MPKADSFCSSIPSDSDQDTDRSSTLPLDSESVLSSSPTPSEIGVPPEQLLASLIFLKEHYTLHYTPSRRRWVQNSDASISAGTPSPTAAAGVGKREVYLSRIPRDCLEDELIPLLEKQGDIEEFRLMLDHDKAGSTRGYAFCVFTTEQAARNAIHELDGHQVRPCRMISVTRSQDNRRLYLGGLPRYVHAEEIFSKLCKLCDNLKDVIIYPSMLDKTTNRGFSFLEFYTHADAVRACKQLSRRPLFLWGRNLSIDWAVPEMEVPTDKMSNVKVVFLRKLTLDTSVEELEDIFSQFGQVERIKKMKDFAFVHLESHAASLKAVQSLDGSEVHGSRIEVTLSKPVDRREYRKWKESKHKSTKQRPAGCLSFPPEQLPIPFTQLIPAPQPDNSSGYLLYQNVPYYHQIAQMPQQHTSTPYAHLNYLQPPPQQHPSSLLFSPLMPPVRFSSPFETPSLFLPHF